MARYGFHLASGKSRLDVKFNNTVVFSANATGVSFFNGTPVAQQSAYTQTYATADKTHANLTATSIAAAVPSAVATTALVDAVTGNFAYDTAAQGDAVATTINSIITHITELDLDYEAILVDLTDLKQLVNSVIDDLQALGLAA